MEDGVRRRRTFDACEIIMRRFLLLAAVLTLPLPALAGEPSVTSKTGNPCAQYGAGFIQVPGTQNCVRAGGQIRMDAYSGQTMGNAPNQGNGGMESGATQSSYDPWKQTR